MNTVDAALISIYKSAISPIPTIDAQDWRTIISMAKQMSKGRFLTKNQAKLALRILKKYRDIFEQFYFVPAQVFDNPTWSKEFMVNEVIKKMYIQDQDRFVIEFSFNPAIESSMSEFFRSAEYEHTGPRNKLSFVLSESNIYHAVKIFSWHVFDIEPAIKEYYDQIVKVREANTNPFNVFSLENKMLKDAIEADIGSIETADLNILNDRKIMYQYTIDKKCTDNSLATIIANRDNKAVFVNSDEHSLQQLFQSLKELKRFPLMIVFDGHNSEYSLKCLNKLQDCINEHGLDKVGIYFRFTNTESKNTEFNRMVTSQGYNVNLDENTQIVGIDNGRLPKFFLTNKWYPRTVISFVNTFKNNKTNMYCDSSDLVIYYNNKEPVIRDIYNARVQNNN